jgi:hypothetical protein
MLNLANKGTEQPQSFQVVESRPAFLRSNQRLKMLGLH